MIDKYMGDCIMAFWGAPLPVRNRQLWFTRRRCHRPRESPLDQRRSNTDSRC